MSATKPKITAIGGTAPTNGAKPAIEISIPYIARVTIQGSADFLFHRWNCEAVAEKANAAKGSKAKKTDDIESYVYRLDDGNLAIPGEYLRMAIVTAAKFRQDPRSPRKSAMDLYKAAVIPLTQLADLGKSQWDYEHRCRAVIQRSAVNRVRPALKAGWAITVEMLVNLPEYISPDTLNETIQQAGRLIGIGDFRRIEAHHRQRKITGFESGPTFIGQHVGRTGLGFAGIPVATMREQNRNRKPQKQLSLRHLTSPTKAFGC